MSKILRFSLVAFLVLTISAIAFGQGTVTGAIGGVVTNEKKEVIPGAAVTVKNTGTNKEETTTTDDQGGFRIGNLEPGSYEVTINARGFSAFTQKVTVEIGRTNALTAVVTIGAQTSQVDVPSDAPVINTSQQDFSSNVNQTQINDLPINGQRWSNFALLSPGTVPDANFGLISFRGISGLLNNNTVDGGDNNQAFFSEEKGRTRINYTISQSAIREFQVNTSNYSAEYGRAAGGVTNAITKSGSNDFHGSAFFYDRDNQWGARNPLGFINTFNAATSATTRDAFKPEDVRHRWGGTIGGPIAKDKAFFFFSYDELRRNFPGLAIFSSPSFLTTINKTTTGVGLENPSIRGLTDSQINSALAFLTSETGPVPRQGNQRIFLPKVDWNINGTNTLTASYNRLRWQSPSGIQTQPTNTIGRTSFGDDFVNDDSVNVRLASTFGANMVNEARFQWSRDNEFENSTTPLAGEPLTAPAYPGALAAGTRSPDVFITNGIEYGVATFLERPQFPFETRKQLADTVTLTVGDHTFKFGGDVNHVRDLNNNLRSYAGSYSYNNINDWVVDYLNAITVGGIKVPGTTPAANVACSTGQPASGPPTKFAGKCYTSNFAQGFGGTVYAFNTTDYNFFIQDDWRYGKNLTVNLGVRYEYERLPEPFAGLPNPAIPQSGQFPKDKNNFGPRFGFAWDINGDGKNSLRAGYGIYYGRIINSTIINAMTNTGMPGGQFQVSVASTLVTCTPSTPATTPCSPSYPNVIPAVSAPTVAVQYFQNHFQAPQIHSMDAIFEHQISRNTVVSFSMLMSFGRSLPTFIDTNLRRPNGTFNYSITNGPFAGQTLTVPYFSSPTAAGVRPISLFGQMTEIRSEVSSTYYGFVTQLTRRLTNGLQFDVNYTRSKARDDGQFSTTFTFGNSPYNAFDPTGERGISNFDFPNKLVADAVYRPKFNVGKSAGAILNGWEISPILQALSGAPLNATVSGSIPARFGEATPAGGINGSGGAARFTLVGRNSSRLPKIVNVDLRVSRRFAIKENVNLQLLVEGFNIFNRTQVTGESSIIYAITSTAATATTPASATLSIPTATPFQQVNAAGGTLYRERQIQIAVRFEF